MREVVKAAAVIGWVVLVAALVVWLRPPRAGGGYWYVLGTLAILAVGAVVAASVPVALWWRTVKIGFDTDPPGRVLYWPVLATVAAACGVVAAMPAYWMSFGFLDIFTRLTGYRWPSSSDAELAVTVGQGLLSAAFGYLLLRDVREWILLTRDPVRRALRHARRLASDRERAEKREAQRR